jgi:hypothetical protein
MLMPNHDDVDAGIKAAVDHRIWEHSQREGSAALGSGRAEAWMFNEQSSNALELKQKSLSYQFTSVCSVEVQRVSDILFGPRVY